MTGPQIWANHYVGVPFTEHGRDLSGCDCWGLVRLVYRSRLGIDLPSYASGYACTSERDEIDSLIGGAEETGPWVRVADDHRAFDVLVFRRGRARAHVALWVAPGRMLHVSADHPARIERFDVARWSNRLCGAYRYRWGASKSGVESPLKGHFSQIGTRVLTAPLIDPGQARRCETVPAGLTVQQIVDLAAPELARGHAGAVRVALVTPGGATVLAPHLWRHVRPKPGTDVVIRLVPGNDTLRAVLLAVVSVAAIALAPHLAGFLKVTSQFGISLVAAGLTVVGGLLVNALIPIQRPEDDGRDTFAIAGWRNQARPDDPIPLVLGRHRMSPPFGATSYTEIVGDDQYVRALFCFGYGRLDLSDLRLGDTLLSDYDNVTIEMREGLAADTPITLYPRQVLEEPYNAELPRPLPRDEYGEVINGDPSVEMPVVRETAADTQTVSVLCGFPGGLFNFDEDGDLQSQTVTVRIRQRLADSDPWIEVVTMDIGAQQRSAFVRQHSWQLPERGRWQIEVTRISEESTGSQISDRVVLSAIQSIRPEHPVNIDKPVCLVALRVKASYQLNGPLENFNAIVQRYGLLWDGEAWVEGLSRNPASAYLSVLQGPSNPFPVPDAEIDWDGLADWFTFCADKGLNYDRVHESAESLFDVLAAVCGAGRATPRHDGLKWGVVIDRPQTLIVDHINGRNSEGFAWTRSYFDPPHGFRINFVDETAGYEQAERVVPWPGHTGDITLTETISLPGKTHPDEVWTEARRRMYELIHRPDSYTVTQDGAARVATRGDLVMGSFDVLSRTLGAARVVSVLGALVELDEPVPGGDLALGLRFRVFDGDDDPVGRSVLRAVAAMPEPSALVRLVGAGEQPDVGQLVQFGPLGTDSLPLRIRGIEGGEGMSSRLSMIAAAPIIDTLTDADTPEPWNGRVGQIVLLDPIEPDAPRLVEVSSAITGLDFEGSGLTRVFGIKVRLRAGTTSLALLSRFRVEYRLSGAADWSVIEIPVASGQTTLDGYEHEDIVQIRARAIATDGTAGPWSNTVNISVGLNAYDAPDSIDDGLVTVTGGLGHATISIAVAASVFPARVRAQLYRVPAGVVLDKAVHRVGAPFDLPSGTTTTYIDGDNTRESLLSDENFDDPALWSGANWAVSGGVASHTPHAGTDSLLVQTIALPAAGFRFDYTVIGRTAGSIRMQLSQTGGVGVVQGPEVTDNGHARGALLSALTSDAVQFLASADFDGAIGQAILFRLTSACVEAGEYDYYLEPLNLDEIPAGVSGPFTVRIG